MLDFLKAKKTEKEAHHSQSTQGAKQAPPKMHPSLAARQEQIRKEAMEKQVNARQYLHQQKNPVELAHQKERDLRNVPRFAAHEEPLAPSNMQLARKRDLGVCIPDHAKNREEKIKSKVHTKKEVSPFEKLQRDYEKSNAEFEKEFEEITSQTPQEPYDYEPDLGVEQVEKSPAVKKLEDPERLARRAKLFEEVRRVMYHGEVPEEKSGKENSAPWEKREQPKKSRISFDADEENEELDEIDASIEKVEGYVPRFSKTAREKLSSPENNEPRASGQFRVTGVYPGGDTTIISGEVVYGKINKRMSAQKGNTTVRVNELKRGLEGVDELYEGETGSVLSRGTLNLIKYGDVLEFS